MQEEEMSVDTAKPCKGAQEAPPAADSMEADWGIDISPDNDKQLLKKILSPGMGTVTPMTGDEVQVHYTGRLLNGDIFDSSVDRNEKFTFKLGQNQVIKGWDVGVATMTRGEKCILTCKPEFAYGSSGSPPKIGPNETLQFEVELFDWKGEDVTGDGGVSKSILVSGEGYSTPEDGSMVEVHLRGTHNGQPFFESDVKFEFGEGLEKGIISGVEQAIGKMKLREKAMVTVQADYGYGQDGCTELNIPAGAELVYEVRLNNFSKVKDAWDYDSLEERLEDATRLKERGGKFFRAGKYELAKKLYKRGAELITDTSLRKEDTKEKARPLRVALHLNLAACHLKMDELTEALKECQEVITDDGENVKAFFRSGQAHVKLQNFEEAINAFEKVLCLEPGNKAAQRELRDTRNLMKTLREREKKRYANMFDRIASKTNDDHSNRPQEASEGVNRSQEASEGVNRSQEASEDETSEESEGTQDS